MIDFISLLKYKFKHVRIWSFLDLAVCIFFPVYGSPTLSDQTKLSCPSIKIGPGDSSRSHTADEFIYIEEIEKGCEIMKKLIKKLLI